MGHFVSSFACFFFLLWVTSFCMNIHTVRRWTLPSMSDGFGVVVLKIGKVECNKQRVKWKFMHSKCFIIQMHRRHQHCYIVALKTLSRQCGYYLFVYEVWDWICKTLISYCNHTQINLSENNFMSWFFFLSVLFFWVVANLTGLYTLHFHFHWILF